MANDFQYLDFFYLNGYSCVFSVYTIIQVTQMGNCWPSSVDKPPLKFPLLYLHQSSGSTSRLTQLRLIWASRPYTHSPVRQQPLTFIHVP